jgi:phenylacetate-CoA ligase
MVESAVVGKRLRYLVVSIRDETGTGRVFDAHYRSTTMRSALSRRQWIPVTQSVEHILQRITELRPDVLSGYGSYIEQLFRLVAGRGLPMHLPRVVRYGGDWMSPEGRAFIEEHFGLPVLSNYNAVEALKIGHFCEVRRGYHLYEDLCDLWIAGANGAPGRPGERGEVVISNLVNRGTVLFNYRLGDFARLSGDPCPCGRTSAVLSSIEGRVGEIIHLPSGDLVHPFAFFPVMKRYKEVTRWRIVQEEPTRFELKLATVDAAAFERVSQPLAREVSDVLEGSTVRVTYDEALGSGPGKHVPVVPLR